MLSDIKRYLDDEGRICIWPGKQFAKAAIAEYLAQSFDCDRFYTEREVNAIIQSRHTFNDYFLLRRTLIDYSMLCRLPDGSKYWKPQKAESHV